MTRIDDDFSIVDSNEAYGDSSVSPLTPEPSSSPNQWQGREQANTMTSEDKANEELSDIVYDNSYVSTFNPQTYLGDVPGLKSAKSLYKRWSSKDVVIAVMG